jgi:RimJ/RimL family protein N-acetyltransferase/GNAT superfamily N-acetyltransferase
VSALAGWTTRPVPQRVALEGRSVRLEPLDSVRHGDDLFAAGSGPEADRLWRYLGEQPFTDRAAFQPWLDKASTSADPLFFATVDPVSGRATGRLALMRIDGANGVIEVGHIQFGPEIARTSGATEAIFLLARHVFENLGYRRFEWKCNDRNEPSKRAAIRLGFSYEGLFRQHMVIKGENRDTAWFAMLDGDWPQRKAAFTRFLDSRNVGPVGGQLLSLSALNALALSGNGRDLRRASRSDLPGLTALQQAAYAENRGPVGGEPLPLLADYGRLIETHEIWLAEGAEGSEGALILDPRPGDLEIWSVATLPALRGRGLGGALLAAAEARARALGLCTLRLFTSDKLSANVAWYGRCGYAVERIEERTDRRLVHMVKTVA